MSRTGQTTGGAVPDYNPELVLALSTHAELRSIELLEAGLSVLPAEGQDEPWILPSAKWRAEPEDFEDTELGLSIKWELDEENLVFAALVLTSLQLPAPEFGEIEEAKRLDGPPLVTSTYRLTYGLEHVDLTDEQCDNFAHWNAPYNVWPFWRELAANLLQRTGVTEMMVPLFRVPAPSRDSDE